MTPMLILYTTEDGKSQIQLRSQNQTVWLTQRDMAELFDVSTDNIGLHLKNIFADGELDVEATVKESLTVQIEGTREVQRPVTLYNLDVILAVGYRVRSTRGVQFRRWASTVLKEYLRRLVQFADLFRDFQIVSPLATQLVATVLTIVMPLARHFTPIALLHVTND